MLFGARFGIINYTPCSTSLCTFICINICHPPPSAIAVWWSYQNSSLPRFVCRRILGDLSNTQCQVRSPSQEGYPRCCKDFWRAPTFDEEMLKSRFSYFKSAAVLMLSRRSSHNCGNASLEHKMHEGGDCVAGLRDHSWDLVEYCRSFGVSGMPFPIWIQLDTHFWSFRGVFLKWNNLLPKLSCFTAKGEQWWLRWWRKATWFVLGVLIF